MGTIQAIRNKNLPPYEFTIIQAWTIPRWPQNTNETWYTINVCNHNVRISRLYTPIFDQVTAVSCQVSSDCFMSNEFFDTSFSFDSYTAGTNSAIWKDWNVDNAEVFRNIIFWRLNIFRQCLSFQVKTSVIFYNPLPPSYFVTDKYIILMS